MNTASSATKATAGMNPNNRSTNSIKKKSNNSNNNRSEASNLQEILVGTPTHVSEPSFEFLFSGILHWVETECQREQDRLSNEIGGNGGGRANSASRAMMKRRHSQDDEDTTTGNQDSDKDGLEDTVANDTQLVAEQQSSAGVGGIDGGTDDIEVFSHSTTALGVGSDDDQDPDKYHNQQQQQSTVVSPRSMTSNNNYNAVPLTPHEIELQKQERAILVAEQAAARMQRLGYDVGYRLVERLSQSKLLTPPPSSSNAKPSAAKIQLEAVKFLCKDVWNEVFRKQIDKLQTNHRGVFVLRDRDFKWLKRLPGDQSASRVMAIKILAFPCGLIRGVLANIGINTVVSCDFLADGKNMANCSFNIKIKSM